MALRWDAAVLLGLAAALAVAVPPALASARWPRRAPRAALALWQAVGLSGGLAILGAGLTLAASDLSTHWLTGITALPRHWSQLGPLGWIGAALTVVAGGWLIAVLAASTRRVTRSRRVHRDRLDLVADDLLVRENGDTGGRLAMVRLLQHDATAAYCVPGLRPQIVLSRGTIDTLSTDELAAVVIHERAHARGRHDLVIHPFRAWRETFAFAPGAALALGAVELLVEMLADDAARRRRGDDALRGALRQLAAGHPDDRDLAARLARLDAPVRRLGRLTTTAIYVAAAALVIVPPLYLSLS